MAAEIAIARATLDDVARIVPLFLDYMRFYRVAAVEASARAFLHERLAHDESVVFIASHDGSDAGFAQLYPTFTSLALARLWILNDLFVAPQVRNGGIATALLKRAESHARETGAARLELSTAVSNRRAQRVYARNDWVRDDEFYTYYREIDRAGLSAAP